jgi:hypothetical protein
MSGEGLLLLERRIALSRRVLVWSAGGKVWGVVTGHTAENRLERMLLQEYHPFSELDQTGWQRGLRDAMRKGRRTCLATQLVACVGCDRVRKPGYQTRVAWPEVDP